MCCVVYSVKNQFVFNLYPVEMVIDDILVIFSFNKFHYFNSKDVFDLYVCYWNFRYCCCCCCHFGMLTKRNVVTVLWLAEVHMCAFVGHVQWRCYTFTNDHMLCTRIISASLLVQYYLPVPTTTQSIWESPNAQEIGAELLSFRWPFTGLITRYSRKNVLSHTQNGAYKWFNSNDVNWENYL